jgi:hypothetical protein
MEGRLPAVLRNNATVEGKADPDRRDALLENLPEKKE